MVSRGSATVDPYARPGGIAIIFGGTNDVGGLTPAQIVANLHTWCDDRKAAGFEKTLVCTLPPSNYFTYAQVTAVNDDIDDHWAEFADGVIDIAADPNIGYAGAEDDTTYFPDGIHLNEAGCRIVAELARDAIAGL
jgi:lysophospholipase L1-like esterase